MSICSEVGLPDGIEVAFVAKLARAAAQTTSSNINGPGGPIIPSYLWVASLEDLRKTLRTFGHLKAQPTRTQEGRLNN